jgi:pre-mRNA-processing factor 17
LIHLAKGDDEMLVNIPYRDLTLPMAGPTRPGEQADFKYNVLTGHAQVEHFNPVEFHTQYRNHQSLGYARDPSLHTAGFVGDVVKAHAWDGASIYDAQAINRDTFKRKPKGRVDVLEGPDAYQGPWAGFEHEILGQPEGAPEAPAPRKALAATETKKAAPVMPQERTIFYGNQEFDYQGRTYMHVPTDVDIDLMQGNPGEQECYLPKRIVHTYAGHQKGVQAIRFFPNSGHLLLSGGMDHAVKLWDVYHDRACLRSYMGHAKAVRDISFSNDGRRFVSTSYDRHVKLWDTETGQCIGRYTVGWTAYCVRFYPHDNNVILAGCANKKVVQWDVNSGAVTQEYDQHLGAVNTITFIEDDRKFMTTSDDKTIRVWEYGVPVVVKLMADPSMHSMPSVAVHPTRQWVACQALNNQVMVYYAQGKFTTQKSKKFTGHTVSGYACQVAFSPDGKVLMSGEAGGNVVFWDWRSTKLIKKFKVHESVCIGVQWHPRETSRVATCGWDGKIHLLD